MRDISDERMGAGEIRATGGIALVYAFRMLGMFMVLPVLTTYGMQLAGATPTLIGAAIGAYGLTQALLQIPVGVLSDRIGRLPVILVGLLIFAGGSVVAAHAVSIWGVIGGRVLQGAGAISAALMALLTDLTQEQHRTKAMAAIGMSIGLSFAVAMVVGPLLTSAFGLSGLFLSTALLALVGLLIMLFFVPRPTQQVQLVSSGASGSRLIQALRNPELLRLNFGIFSLHAMLMASFIALPMVLVQRSGLPREQHWWVYLVTLLVSFVLMVPFIIYGEKKRRMKQLLIGAIGLLLICELYFWFFGYSLGQVLLGLLLFFTAFNLLESSLPSLVSKTAPADGKGTAMGVYSTSQFLGTALGGLLGGWLYQHAGLSGDYLGCALVALSWLLVAVTMKEPPYVTSVRLPLSPAGLAVEGLAARLMLQPGVTEAVVRNDEAALYIKMDTKQLNRAALEQLIQGMH